MKKKPFYFKTESENPKKIYGLDYSDAYRRAVKKFRTLRVVEVKQFRLIDLNSINLQP